MNKCSLFFQALHVNRIFVGAVRLLLLIDQGRLLSLLNLNSLLTTMDVNISRQNMPENSLKSKRGK